MTPDDRQRFLMHEAMRAWADEYGPSLYTDLGRQLRSLLDDGWWRLSTEDIVWGVIETLREGDWSEWGLDEETERLLSTVRVEGSSENVAAWALEWLVPPAGRR